MSRRPFIPSQPSIGRARKTREQVARETLDRALAERGYAFAGFEPESGGDGIVAVAVNGQQRVIMHLGRNATDAMFSLASLTTRKEGRA